MINTSEVYIRLHITPRASRRGSFDLSNLKKRERHWRARHSENRLNLLRLLGKLNGLLELLDYHLKELRREAFDSIEVGSI